MKVGAVILARMTSSRLPGKGLKIIQGKEVLKHIIDNLSQSKYLTDIIIATSNEQEDDLLYSFCQKKSIKCFRGSLDNVASRFLKASISSDLDYVVRVNGDNLFVNIDLLDKAVNIALSGIELISNVPNRTYPKGMSVEVINVSFYSKMYDKFHKKEHYEHVTTYLYENIDKISHYFIENKKHPNAAGIQIAIDTQYDFDLATKVMSKLKVQSGKVELNKLLNIFNDCEKEMNFKGKHGPLMIAEIGGNHEGDFEYAKKLAKLAIKSDSDFIKFQIYSGNSLVNPVQSPDRHKHFKKFELSREQYVELAQMITNAGKRFMASIWDVDMIDWVDEYNPIYKIGSGDLLAWPLLKNITQRGKPIILSTGLATEDEVVATVNFIRECNSLYEDSNYLAVLQCTSMYPIPKSAANLLVMDRLEELTGATKGYSDHTEGADALKCSIAMGAQVLEYHFTDSREGKEFRDHKVSLTYDEILDVIEYIKMVNIMHGQPTKEPVQIEIDNGHVESFHRAVYPSRDIKKGEIVTEDCLVILRPDVGLSSRNFYQLIGKVAKHNLSKFQVISVSDFV